MNVEIGTEAPIFLFWEYLWHFVFAVNAPRPVLAELWIEGALSKTSFSREVWDILAFFIPAARSFSFFFVIYGCLPNALNQSPPVYESFLIICWVVQDSFCRCCFLLGELLQAVVVLVAHVLIGVLIQNVASRNVNVTKRNCY